MLIEMAHTVRTCYNGPIHYKALFSSVISFSNISLSTDFRPAEERRRKVPDNEDYGNRKRGRTDARTDSWHRGGFDQFSDQGRPDFGNRNFRGREFRHQYSESFRGRGGFNNSGGFRNGGNRFVGQSFNGPPTGTTAGNMGILGLPGNLPMGPDGIPDLSQVPPALLQQLAGALQKFQQQLSGYQSGSQGNVPGLLGDGPDRPNLGIGPGNMGQMMRENSGFSGPDNQSTWSEPPRRGNDQFSNDTGMSMGRSDFQNMGAVWEVIVWEMLISETVMLVVLQL